MRFNLLLYVPALTNNPDIEYGVFIQHHLMDDANVELTYFDFSKINPETYALDIVDTHEVTKKVRKDCLVEGYTLNSYYSIDLDSSFTRSINKEEVRQIFICFKDNSKAPMDAFVRLTHDNVIRDYHSRDNLIFFRLWVAPEIEEASKLSASIFPANYSDFDYFRSELEAQVNKQWHSILDKKRDLSKARLTGGESRPETPTVVTPEPAPPFINTPNEETYDPPFAPSDFRDDLPQQDQEPIVSLDNPLVVSNDEGSSAFKVIAYILLFLGILSILGKIFGNG